MVQNQSGHGIRFIGDEGLVQKDSQGQVVQCELRGHALFFRRRGDPRQRVTRFLRAGLGHQVL